MIFKRTPKAKAFTEDNSDIVKRKYRERIGLETLVVYTVNTGC